MHARRQANDARLDPVARDALLAAGCAAILLICAATNGEGYVDAGAVAIAIAACAPVAVRTINPMAALVGTVSGAFVALATFKPEATVLSPIALALYTVALTGCRTRTALCAAATVALTVVAMMLFTDESIWRMEVLEKTALILLPLLAGEAMREHRAFKREEAERIERAMRAREADADRRIEQERLRIAREVHDVVAHSMVAINVQAGVAAHVMGRRPEAARDALLDIKRVSGEALRDLRATLGVLRAQEPAPVAPSPTLDGVDDLAGGLRAAGIDVEVAIARDDSRPLPSALEGAGFRIVQEALTNVLRHSRATSARVAIAVDDRGLSIEVVDAGPCEEDAVVPARGAEPGSGNGLQGMRERAAAVGGSLEAGPRDGGGWRVHARLPLGVPA
ncbi:MAG TPA: sensor histidine kinase [Baekduia sp.]|nr:sensor histidine kinase [Baekduia sp.]